MAVGEEDVETSVNREVIVDKKDTVEDSEELAVFDKDEEAVSDEDEEAVSDEDGEGVGLDEDEDEVVTVDDEETDFELGGLHSSMLK